MSKTVGNNLKTIETRGIDRNSRSILILEEIEGKKLQKVVCGSELY